MGKNLVIKGADFSQNCLQDYSYITEMFPAFSSYEDSVIGDERMFNIESANDRKIFNLNSPSSVAIYINATCPSFEVSSDSLSVTGLTGTSPVLRIEPSGYRLVLTNSIVVDSSFRGNTKKYLVVYTATEINVYDEEGNTYTYAGTIDLSGNVFVGSNPATNVSTIIGLLYKEIVVAEL